jgi:pilus assembly protein CpaC
MADRTPTATLRCRFWRRTAPLAAVLGLAWVGTASAQVTTHGGGPKAVAGLRATAATAVKEATKPPQPKPLPPSLTAKPAEPKVVAAKAEEPKVEVPPPPAPPRALDRTQFAEPAKPVAVKPAPGPELATVPEPPPIASSPKPPVMPPAMPTTPTVPVSAVPSVTPGPASPISLPTMPANAAAQPIAFQPAPMVQPKPEEKTPQVPQVQPKPDAGTQLPPPKVFPEGAVRLPLLGGPVGTTPQPSEEDLAKFRTFIDGLVDPMNTLDVIEGRARLLLLKEVPTQFQLVDPTVISANQLNDPKQFSVLGKKPGTTVLNLWFKDPKDEKKEVILSYLVRVLPDPEAKARLERVYKALEEEINKAFPKSRVRLTLVGDKLMVSGQAHDIYDASEIMRVLRSNAPGGGGNQGQIQRPLVNTVGATAPNPLDPTNPTGTPGQSSYILDGGANVINNMRVVGEHQVLLRVTVAEVNRAAARSIGVNFSVINNQGINVFSNTTGNINAGNLLVNLDNGQVPLAINALRTLNYARSLAEPNLTALNGQPAFFLAGGQFPVPVLGGVGQFGGGGLGGGFGGGLQGVQFVPFGVQLTFTPFITDRDRIRLTMFATVSTRDNNAGANIGGANVPGLNARTFSTTVEMREGQTMAVAGLIQNNIGADSQRVPFLGDLPYLGRLLSLDRTTSGEQELVVLVTPELVHPLNQNELLPLPGSDVYEPGDLEFYLRGRLESRRSEDYRASVRTDWDRMLAYRRCEKLYISGPTGHVEGVFNRPLTAPTIGK